MEFAFPSANDFARVNTTVTLASDERSAKVSFKSTETLRHEAWQVTTTCALTGEAVGYKSPVPKHPYDRASGGWGAFELAARYERLSLDAATFPIYADPKSSVRRADSWGAGINWYLNKSVRLMLDFDQTQFDGGGGSKDRATEKSLSQRFQIAL